MNKLRIRHLLNFQRRFHTKPEGSIIIGAIVLMIMLIFTGCDTTTGSASQAVDARYTSTPPTSDGISPVEDARIPKPYKAVLNAPDGSEVNVGGQAIYQITVTNKGINDDTYTTFVSSKHGWADASGVPASIFLKPEQRAVFTTTVNVPVDAAPTTDDALDVSVRGEHGAFDEYIIHTVVCCSSKHN